MTRTRRDKPPGRGHMSGRDGSTRPNQNLAADAFAKTVQRRDRRDRDAETSALEAGRIDADDVPIAPKPKRRWAFWKIW